MIGGAGLDLNDFNDVHRKHGIDAARECFDTNRVAPRGNGQSKDGLPNDQSKSERGNNANGAAGAREHAVDSAKQAGGAKRTQAQILIEIATGPGVTLFHSPEGTGYADIIVDEHRETWSLRSPGFRWWLRRAYYEATGSAPNSDAINTAMGVIEARAHFDGQKHPVHLCVASVDQRIYLDLCDESWRAIEIVGDGWRLVDRPPVRFRRTTGMLPIPEPVRGGNIKELQEHIRVDEGGFVLLVSWLLAVLRGRGPYPILGLTREQGTGKSSTAEKLRRLLDPNIAPLRSLPRDTRDLYVAAINGHVLVFDNLSWHPGRRFRCALPTSHWRRLFDTSAICRQRRGPVRRPTSDRDDQHY
jgi:hypothetical protein